MSRTAPKPRPHNLLIQDQPGETLNSCANVLNFLLDASREVDLESNRDVSNGYQWVHMLVIDAIAYEADRALNVQRPTDGAA
jgi:hypothetical protein